MLSARNPSWFWLVVRRFGGVPRVGLISHREETLVDSQLPSSTSRRLLACPQVHRHHHHLDRDAIISFDHLALRTSRFGTMAREANYHWSSQAHDSWENSTASRSYASLTRCTVEAFRLVLVSREEPQWSATTPRPHRRGSTLSMIPYAGWWQETALTSRLDHASGRSHHNPLQESHDRLPSPVSVINATTSS